MIFFRSYLLVMCITLSTWCIANNRYALILGLSFCISLIWSFNVTSISNSGLKEKIYYSLGALVGTGSALIISRYL